MKPVRIVAQSPAIDITVPMGDGASMPTGGLGGWEEVPRYDDLPMTDWSGQPLLTEDVPLLLNGLERNESQEREWNTIKKLGRDPNGDERKPPVFRVYGPVEYPGKAWVLPANGIEVREKTTRPGSGEILRVEFVLHLLEYMPLEKRSGRMGVSRGVAISYTTQKGDTLIKVAHKFSKDWGEIGAKNGISDPYRELKTGRELRL